MYVRYPDSQKKKQPFLQNIPQVLISVHEQ